jgi:hypothetical protein
MKLSHWLMRVCSRTARTCRAKSDAGARGLLAAVSVAAGVAWAQPAAAEIAFGLEVNYNEAVDQLETGKGGGVDVRVGPRLELWMLQITPELSAGMHDFGGFPSPTVLRGLAGCKVALDLGIRPTLFAHFGAGRLRYDAVESTARDATTGMAADFGAALDVNVLPMLDVGVQGSYNLVGMESTRSRFDWLQVGGHFTFILDRSRS